MHAVIFRHYHLFRCTLLIFSLLLTPLIVTTLALELSSGFTVVDLGKDVAVDDVVDAVKENKPFLVTGTALMTTTMTAFPSGAKKLQEAGINIPYMAAGGAVNRDFAESFDLGIYSEKAPQTPPIADKILAGYDWKKIREEWDSIVGGE